jgi:hypothetical protein
MKNRHRSEKATVPARGRGQDGTCKYRLQVGKLREPESNQHERDYEPRALPLSYPANIAKSRPEQPVNANTRKNTARKQKTLT